MSGASLRLERVVTHVVGELVRSGRMELVPGAQPEAVVAAVLVEIADAGAFSQAGSTISRALIRSPLVEEVFAEDDEILSLLNFMYG